MEEYLRSSTEKFLQLVGTIDIFIDCGVGKEGSEAWTVNRIQPNCEIIGFEPEHRRFDRISKIYPGKMLKLAIAENNGVIEGYMGHDKGKQDFWLMGGENAPKNSYIKEEVACIRLDTFIEENNLINKRIAVWADIEGSELIMLKSCGKYLKTIMGFNLELWPFSIQEQKSYKKEDLINWMEENNYKTIKNNGQDYIFINKGLKT